ncbi:MAG: hypothetical protein M5U34_46105 [Chloroflexi bacterium]|nr:hypothetical protein [Chloroflexota bacterium]
MQMDRTRIIFIAIVGVAVLGVLRLWRVFTHFRPGQRQPHPWPGGHCSLSHLSSKQQTAVFTQLDSPNPSGAKP